MSTVIASRWRLRYAPITTTESTADDLRTISESQKTRWVDPNTIATSMKVSLYTRCSATFTTFPATMPKTTPSTAICSTSTRSSIHPLPHTGKGSGLSRSSRLSHPGGASQSNLIQLMMNE